MTIDEKKKLLIDHVSSWDKDRLVDFVESQLEQIYKFSPPETIEEDYQNEFGIEQND